MEIDSISGEAQRGRGGRPKKDQVELVEQTLLSAARTVFLAKGYANATLTEIAALARASKRTIYDRHPNKATLFEAAISAFIKDRFLPIENLPLQAGSLREKLLCLAQVLTAIATDEETIAIHRIAAAEQLQFPHLVQRLRRYGFERAVDIVKNILVEHNICDPTIAAEIFYATFVLAPLHHSMVAAANETNAIEKRVQFFVRALGPSAPADRSR